MTRAEAKALLAGAPAEPISPEYDPVWLEACDLLRSTSLEPKDDHLAVARTVRAVRFDLQSRQARSWIPAVLMLLASTAAFFALAEAVTPRPVERAPQPAPYLGSYLDSPDVRR